MKGNKMANKVIDIETKYEIKLEEIKYAKERKSKIAQWKTDLVLYFKDRTKIFIYNESIEGFNEKTKANIKLKGKK